MALEPLHRQGSPLVAQKPQADSAVVLENAEFWPAIQLRDFDLRYGADGVYAEERRVHCLTQAMMWVNDELEAWSCEQVTAGYNTLDEVPSRKLGECSEKLHHYRAAVYSHAMGLLQRRFWSSADTVGDDHSPSDFEAAADEYYAERWNAIRALTGEPRCIVEAL